MSRAPASSIRKAMAAPSQFGNDFTKNFYSNVEVQRANGVGERSELPGGTGGRPPGGSGAPVGGRGGGLQARELAPGPTPQAAAAANALTQRMARKTILTM